MGPHHPPSSRRGVVLLVVLTLLTLFAVVGLSFVLYANTAAHAAQLRRDAESVLRPDLDPELLFAYFLGQLLYDVPDDETGVYSALRGHSLARSMYGANAKPGANLVPFNGTGRLRYRYGGLEFPVPTTAGWLGGAEDHKLINYTFYRGDDFLRDPERPGLRAPDLAAPRKPYTGGVNAGYTYPDLNNVFLAAVRGDGTVLLPSFHRPWTTFGSLDPSNLNWRLNDKAAHKLLKYQTLRPRPAEHPGFPLPEDAGGDVKNLVGSPGTLLPNNAFANNDSIWLDLGFPVMTAPDGRKFKPLFAALVTDLDNRLNVNVHGNVAGHDGQHRSNQGWGPWEVNLGKVLGQPTNPPHEAGRLLRGVSTNSPSPLWHGRYGPDGQPTSRHPNNQAPPTIRAHFYSQVDFDGRNEGGNGVTPRWELPGVGGGTESLRTWFPTFGPGYGNASAAERTNHALLFDVFQPMRQQPGNYDRAYAVSNMEALLRYGDTGSPALAADLFRLCPTNFQERLARGLLTTHSFDLDRPGAPPWVYNAVASTYMMAATEDVDRLATPRGAAANFRPPRERGAGPFDARLDQGDFGGADWRSLAAALGRVNLSRPLPPYPHQGSGTAPPFGPPLTVNTAGQIALDMPFSVDAPDGRIWKQFVLAQEARQKLTNDLYLRLLVVTGVSPARPDQLRVRRWLAQLAANIVDYVDEDDINTPFHFEGDANLVSRPDEPGGEIQWPLHWVFGTELPRVVVNEALAEIGTNNPEEAYSDKVRVFVELHNTFPRDVPQGTYQPDGLPVPLRMGQDAPYAPYRILISTKSVVRPGDPLVATIHPGAENDNVLGNPDAQVARTQTTNADFRGSVAAGWAGTSNYAPIAPPFVPAHGPDTPADPQGFLLLGPRHSELGHFALHDPFERINDNTPMLRRDSLEYVRDFPDSSGELPLDERTHGVSVLLRRLANPYLPFEGRRELNNGEPNPTYNPYVTVDYLEEIELRAVGQLPPPQNVPSTGRGQAYAAHREFHEPQLGGTSPMRHSFGLENNSLQTPFDWLTHLDRPLISPAELLHVSGCQPYQLTQRFMLPNNQRFKHQAPWLDASSRLYRFLDFVEAGPQAAGVAAGGRIPGKININTLWDPHVLRALADAQPSNHFTEVDVNGMFSTRLYDKDQASLDLGRRTKGIIPGPDDRPFWGLSMGHYPPGDPQFHTLGGLDDTILRLRNQPAGHPYVNAELLTKMFNHLTTRSNVFAVWLTVGFFEVTDETTRPVRLGAELGKAENRHVRHRMFAVLDRTNLSVASWVAALREPVTPGPTMVAVSALSGTTELAATGPNLSWKIEPGTTLVADVGPNQEVVEVLDVIAQPPAIVAVFTKPHAANTPISLANVPGAPPVFLKPSKVLAPTAPSRTYTVTLPVDPELSDPAARAAAPAFLAGVYDGIPWKVQAGTKLLIDVGPDQELVEVQRPLGLDRQAGTGTFRFVAARPHAGEFLLTNTLLGNPGPRPHFNPRDPSSAAVVRYLSVIQ